MVAAPPTSVGGVETMETGTDALPRTSQTGYGVKTWRRKLPGVLTARGGLRTRPRSPSLCRMPTLPSSGFHHPWWCGLSLICRTAVCGPACTVVWQGRRGDPSPYVDCLGVCASGDDVMADALADFIASNLAGVARLQAYLLHLRGPLPAMVATARRRSVALLPDMRHFVGEG
jgi:hypothetical protein